MKPKLKIINIVLVILFFFFLGLSFYIPKTEYGENRTVILVIIALTMLPALVASYIGIFSPYKKEKNENI